MLSLSKNVLALLLPMALAAPAWAGTVYVPHPGNVEIGGVEYKTQIWASNVDESEARRIEHYFIRSLSDGTERDAKPTVVRVGPGRTTRLEIDSASSGLVEIFAAPQVVITARLVQKVPGPGPLAGAQLPVIDSDNVVEAGETAHLQGWERIENVVTTTFGLANLGDESAQCMVKVFRADGSQIKSTALLLLSSLSHVQFREALDILDAGNVKDVRSEVTCDQPFFPYVAVFADDPAGVVYVVPSASGKSELHRPAEEGDFVYLSDIPWTSTSNIEWGPWADRTGVEGGRHGEGPVRQAFRLMQIKGEEYEKGISWIGHWGNSAVSWSLNGAYSRFTTLVRIDDEPLGRHEWGIVDADGNIVGIKRPIPSHETRSVFKIGAGGSLQVIGDGKVLYRTRDFYAYGEPVFVDLDVTGVETLRLVFVADHVEQPDAPHRQGLDVPKQTKKCPWWDLLVIPDAKLYPAGS
jgi:hypothetical protein